MRLRNITGSREVIAACDYVVHEPQQYRGRWEELFGNNHPIRIEIGMGKGRFIMDLARANPDINYIGIEKYSSVLLRGIQKMEADPLINLYFIRMEAEEITEVFGPGEVERIYLNFSDPWPKVRHHSRLLTSKIFLEKYDTIFKEKASIYLRTDNEDLFSYSLVSLSNAGYIFKEVNLDLHRNENLITTEYEEKFANRGVKIKAFIAEKSTSNKDKS